MHDARTLAERLAALLSRELDSLADFLVALADFDVHHGWSELGYPSLFYFLHRELRLSKGAAQYRKVAAELIQRVPAVVEPLRDGRLCLTSIVEASKVVTAENWETVLPRFYGLSKRDAMNVVAALQPHPAPPTRTVITVARSVSASRSSPPAGPEQRATQEPTRADVVSAATLGWPDEPPSPPAPVARPAELVPLSAEQGRLHVTVTARFARKLEAAKDARPEVTTEELLEAGLDLLLAQVAKRRGLVEKPQQKVRPSKPDHIPAQVRREVWKRDGGRCQWKLPNGEICGCTRHLQFDHIKPLALGGTSTVDNVRILCRSHNLEAARLVFGDAWMDRYTRRQGRQPMLPRTGSPALCSNAKHDRAHLRAGRDGPPSTANATPTTRLSPEPVCRTEPIAERGANGPSASSPGHQ